MSDSYKRLENFSESSKREDKIPKLESLACIDTSNNSLFKKPIQMDNKRYKCTVCKDVYGSFQYFLRHIEGHFEIKLKQKSKKPSIDTKLKYQCNICSKTFQTKTVLQSHLSTHSKRTFACNICDANFPQEKALNKHMILHTCEKQYKCEICQKSFKLKQYLKLHRETHSRYECGECGKKFLIRGNLIQHLEIHSEERKYKCQICDKTFKQKGSLRGHLQIHIGKEYKCRICGRRFTRYEFTRHLKKIHPDGDDDERLK